MSRHLLKLQVLISKLEARREGTRRPAKVAATAERKRGGAEGQPRARKGPAGGQALVKAGRPCSSQADFIVSLRCPCPREFRNALVTEEEKDAHCLLTPYCMK